MPSRQDRDGVGGEQVIAGAREAGNGGLTRRRLLASRAGPDPLSSAR